METDEAKFRTEWWVRNVFEVNVGRLRDGLGLQEVEDSVREHVRELAGVVGICDVRKVVIGNVELVMRCGYAHGSGANMAAYPYGLSKEYDMKINDLSNPE